MVHKLLMAVLLLALVASFAAGYALAISLMVMRGVIWWEVLGQKKKHPLTRVFSESNIFSC